MFPIPIRRGFSHSPLLSTQMAYPSAAVPTTASVDAARRAPRRAARSSAVPPSPADLVGLEHYREGSDS